MTTRQSRIAPVLVVLVGGLVVALVAAWPAYADEYRPQPHDDPGALRLLAAARRAPAIVAYDGVQYVAAWGRNGAMSQVVDITHVPQSGTVVTVRGTAAAPGMKVFAPAADAADAVPLLARNYTLSLKGAEQVAGRPCVIVEARRPGGSLAARFWLDRETQLMLRREVYDRTGEVVKASSFVEISFDGRARLDMHLPPAIPDPITEHLPVAAAPALRADGWTVPSTVKPNLALYRVQTTVDDTGTIVHLSYSDGLSTVSVFEQRGHLDAKNLVGFRKIKIGGAPVYIDDEIPYRASWSANGVVYTVVTDTPEEIAHAVIEALPRQREDDGVLSRVGRGMSRVASWFNPFG